MSRTVTQRDNEGISGGRDTQEKNARDIFGANGWQSQTGQIC